MVVLHQEKTLKSFRLVRDKICSVRGVLKFPVSRVFISSVKDGHAKYVPDLDAEKKHENKEKTEKEK